MFSQQLTSSRRYGSVEAGGLDCFDAFIFMGVSGHDRTILTCTVLNPYEFVLNGVFERTHNS